MLGGELLGGERVHGAGVGGAVGEAEVRFQGQVVEVQFRFGAGGEHGDDAAEGRRLRGG